MLKHIIFALSCYLISLSSFAQSNQMDQVLKEIEQNNKELKAFQSLMGSRNLEFKAGQHTKKLQLSGFYLPFGEHLTTDYYEFQVSQSFDFPTVYAVRNILMDKKGKKLQLEYEQLRQEILVTSKKHCQELIYLIKLQQIEQNRISQVKQIYTQVQEQFEKEKIEILELNKAKIVWLQDQLKVQQIEREIRNVLYSLQKLNGGEKVDFNQSDFPNDLEIAAAETIWQQINSQDPHIKTLKESEAIAMQEVQLQKNKLLPELTAGYNYQGIAGNNYSGFYGGLSIPILNGKNNINAAKANYQYKQTNAEMLINELYLDFLNQYQEYNIMLLTYREYESTLEGLNNDQLLLDDYRQEKISFLEYHGELQFYQEAYDKMLEIEKELHQLKTELLKYQL